MNMVHIIFNVLESHKRNEIICNYAFEILSSITIDGKQTNNIQNNLTSQKSQCSTMKKMR